MLYDDVLPTPPGFATYALINATSFFAGVSYTRFQHIVDAEVRSMIPGGQFRTRLAGAFADGGECYITSSGDALLLRPYPPQQNERDRCLLSHQRSRRCPSAGSVQHRANTPTAPTKASALIVRRLKLPLAPTSIDCENAACALLDDTVQHAWQGEYKIVSDFLPVEDVLPGNAVQVSAPFARSRLHRHRSRGRAASRLARRRSLAIRYQVRQRCRDPLALKFERVSARTRRHGLRSRHPSSSPLIDSLSAARIYDTGTPSSSLYIDSLTAAQVTNVIATEITIDAGVAPPAGGGIEVRRSDGGWGSSDSDNLAARFTTQQFTVPRLERVQGYYLRQYDGSSPAKYSRYSVLLHVDYPL